MTVEDSGQKCRHLLTLQKPPRPSSIGVPSGCLQTSMSSAWTLDSDHFCMSLKELSGLPTLPGKRLEPSVPLLPAEQVIIH